MSRPGTSANRIRAALRPLRVLALWVLASLLVARLLLVSLHAERVADAGMFTAVFVQGLRFDLVLTGLLLAPLLVMFPLLATSERLVAVWRIVLAVYLPAAVALVIFMEASTPSFIAQFDSRPNILFVEYLDHPREVMATLWTAYRLPLAFTLPGIVALLVVIVRRNRAAIRSIQAVRPAHALLTATLLLAVCAAMIRSTLDHRPVNPSTVALSTDPLVNDLALNSTYTVLYAIYETRHESGGGSRYLSLEEDEVIAAVRGEMRLPDGSFVPGALPTLHRQVAAASGPPRNLVIIIEESLGAEFVGRLGGLDLTPNLDALSADGIWFENLYATGTRSVRGLEAVISGFTPTPARSVVKLPKSQKNFFTLAALLKQAGYETSFIYGGEAQFDNMRRFFVNNGFERVIDENDYEDPVFTGSWGVSDEDLFSRAHETFANAGERPFFSVVFTSSNHSPYQFPDGRIERHDAEKNTVNNAVKYADFALGQFFRDARSSAYWENTVFLVVADHNSRVYGSEIVPVERFHIPGVILGGPITPQVFEPVASQIDLAPTLLSLIGMSATHPMIGHDLTRPEFREVPGRAIMQFNGTQAYMEGDRVVLLRKDLPAVQMTYRHGHLTDEQTVDPALLAKAGAHATWSSIAYERSLYRLN